MSYQQHCEEFALFGDQRQEDMDYELMAAYDRWDGHRADLNDQFDHDPEPTPEEAWMGVLWEEDLLERQWEQSWANVGDPVPF